MVESNEEQRAGPRAPTVCYLFLAHHKFDLLRRTVERLNGPGTGFVFHLDRKVPQAAVDDFRATLPPAVQHVAFAQRERSGWAAYGQALAIMRLIQAALDRLPPFDRYVLASGQCYPFVSRAQIVDFFAQHPTTEFVETTRLNTSDPKAPGWSPYYCFRRYHVWIGKRHFPWPLLRKPEPALPIYQGSEWWALTRAAVEHVRREFEGNHRFRRQMQSSIFVDEAYVPSVMMASPLAANIASRNLTYADFTQTHLTGPHPTILTSADLPAILASGKFLARKVDPAVDAALLDLLDRHAAAGPAVAPPLAPSAATS